MNKKIYFCGAVRGGREDAALYARIIAEMKKTDTVLTEHVGNVHLSTAVKTLEKEWAIYEQDTAWLKACDLVIAECSQPSLGVGYELAYAEQARKPVYVFCRKGGHPLSAMISGDPYFQVYEYDSEEELLEVVHSILVAET